MSEPPLRIRICPQGPLLVHGTFILVDEAGQETVPERSSVALCRCGRSSIQPLCDGSHKVGKPPIQAVDALQCDRLTPKHA